MGDHALDGVHGEVGGTRVYLCITGNGALGGGDIIVFWRLGPPMEAVCNPP